MLFDHILQTIGRTPLIQLRHLAKDIPANVYAKCEFFNPGGSVKDRIAKYMVEEARQKGLIQPGDTLIEPTSGNTGIGLALCGAVYGYKIIIVMPDKMSLEKEVTLKALGASIIRTPAKEPFDSPKSHIEVAKSLQKELPRAHILDQYANLSNPRAHYESTAQEIIEDLNGQVDMLVAGAGTGGTLTGIAQKFKKEIPDCEIIGVDPEGSLLAGEEEIKPYEVEGIGYDFIPKILDRSLITKWIKTNDKQAFFMARQACQKEGLLCGGSSGSALFACLNQAKRLKKGQNCVVILADGIRNYMSKFLDDEWLKNKGLFYNE